VKVSSKASKVRSANHRLKQRFLAAPTNSVLLVALLDKPTRMDNVRSLGGAGGMLQANHCHHVRTN